MTYDGFHITPLLKPQRRHSRLAPRLERSREMILELEAESSAYMVAEHSGLEGLARPNYVALHGADAEMILAHIERIRNTAAEIIQALEVEP